MARHRHEMFDPELPSQAGERLPFFAVPENDESNRLLLLEKPSRRSDQDVETLVCAEASYAEHEVTRRILRQRSSRFRLDPIEIDRVGDDAHSSCGHAQILGEPPP